MRAAVVPVAFAVAFAIDATALNPGWGYSLLLYPTAIFLAALSFGMVGARAGASLGGPDRPKPGKHLFPVERCRQGSAGPSGRHPRICGPVTILTFVPLKAAYSADLRTFEIV